MSSLEGGWGGVGQVLNPAWGLHSAIQIQQFGCMEMGNCRDVFEKVSGPAGSHLQCKHFKAIEIHTLTHSRRRGGLPYNNYRPI